MTFEHGSRSKLELLIGYRLYHTVAPNEIVWRPHKQDSSQRLTVLVTQNSIDIARPHYRQLREQSTITCLIPFHNFMIYSPLF